MESIAGLFNQTEAQLAREIRDGVDAGLPAEKEQAKRDMILTANALQKRGSDRVDGRGQAAASIPRRIYFRWAQMLPGCWQDKQFVDEFLQDNPQCCAPGYRPRPSGLRHGFTFSAGKAIYHKYKANMSVIS